MSLLGWLTGRDKDDDDTTSEPEYCADYNPYDAEPETLLERLSGDLECYHGVSLLRSSHTHQHGLLGLLGHVDESTRNVETAGDAWAEGRLTDSEMGYACKTWHDAENEKPAWKYFLGL